MEIRVIANNILPRESQLKELLSSWSDDIVYGIDSDAFGKLSHFNVNTRKIIQLSLSR